MTYTLLPNGHIQRDSDRAVIPPDRRNGDYAAYLLWLAAGNTPSPIATSINLSTDDSTFGDSPWLF